MQKDTTNFLLRIAIAFAFLYPAIAIHIDPNSWIGYFPSFILDLTIPQSLLFFGFSLGHIVIAVWLLYGKKIFIPSLLASLALLGIITFNLSQINVIFRDISLLLVTVYLAVEAYNKEKKLGAFIS